MNFLKQFWRTFNGHVLVVAFLIGLFAVVMVGIQQALSRAESSVKGSLSLVVFLQNNVTDAEAASLNRLADQAADSLEDALAILERGR